MSIIGNAVKISIQKVEEWYMHLGIKWKNIICEETENWQTLETGLRFPTWEGFCNATVFFAT